MTQILKLISNFGLMRLIIYLIQLLWQTFLLLSLISYLNLTIVQYILIIFSINLSNNNTILIIYNSHCLIILIIIKYKKSF